MFDAADSSRLLAALGTRYSAGFLDTDEGRRIAQVDIHERQFWFRQRYVPWIQTVVPLTGARVLEVGTGYGSATVCLAERGATVDTIDMDDDGLILAIERAELVGVRDRIRFQTANATEIAALFGPEQFDLIIYTASVEHMTFAERPATLSAAWSMLEPDGVLSIVDTPNRLWYFDDHTSFDNFFHWLPDDVAIAYARYSNRPGLWAAVEGPHGNEQLARWGRGVSYHDLMIALGEDPSPFYASGEWDHRRQVDPDWATWWSTTNDGRYHALLRDICPDLPSGFLEPELAICLRKPSAADAGSEAGDTTTGTQRRHRIRPWGRRRG
jgi:S-adenosylmethionine-dependent methyltransferase